MNRRTFLCGIVLGTLSAPLVVRAQQPGKVHRIGFLAHVAREDLAPFPSVFEQRLREIGYGSGGNTSIEYRFSDAKPERLQDLAEELVRLRPDVIVAHTNQAIAAVKRATRAIPVVMVVAVDPVGAGFVASLPRPGSNMTGLTFDVSDEIWEKRLEFLKEATSASRLGVLWNPEYLPNRARWKTIHRVAPKLGLTFIAAEVRLLSDVERGVGTIASQGARALFVLGDPVLFGLRKRVADAVIGHRLPSIEPYRERPEAGGLMSYGTDFHHMYRRAADYVGQILRGADPADLPVEQPTKFELIINLKTAKALGLTIPQSLLIRADGVIQ